jgi:hypothetical protein
MAISMADGQLYQLELLALGDGAWRLFDHSVEGDDPASIVAYIEQTTVGIEVVWLRGRGGTARFDDLSDVLRAAAMELSLGAGSRATRPIEIPHFAPRMPPRTPAAPQRADDLMPDGRFDVNPMGGSAGRQ